MPARPVRFAALVAAAGLAAATIASCSDPAGEATTTITSTRGATTLPGQLVGGFSWSLVHEFGEAVTVDSIVSTSAGLFALGRAPDGSSRALRSVDGTAWTTIDVSARFGDGASVQRIAERTGTLAAFGVVGGDSGADATAWTSRDGETWTAASLGFTVPVGTGSYDRSQLVFEHVALGPPGAVVTATLWPAVDQGDLEDRVWGSLPDGLDRRLDRLRVVPETVEVLAGPLAVFSADLAALGLPEDLVQGYRDRYLWKRGRPMHFLSSDLESWEWVDGSVLPLGEADVRAVVATGAGFVAAGEGFVSDDMITGGVFTSADGRSWALGRTAVVDAVSIWAGRLTAISWDSGVRSLWSFDDPAGPWDVIGENIPALDAAGLVAGPVGLLAPDSGFEPGYDTGLEPVTVVDHAGRRLEIRPAEEVAELRDGAGLVAGWELDRVRFGHGFVPPRDFAIDYGGRSITITDPGTGAELMTVTFDELAGAFRAGFSGRGSPWGESGHVLFHSSDGRSWTEIPMRSVTGTDGAVTASVAGDAMVIVAMAGPGGRATLWRGG